ncbi:MAG: ribosome biogenesis GTPase Der [Gammaproteobacteria bacterium]|nr:ribosome biogenesis GTPase Der [Gammaproteobacteria bacterium]MDH3413397.1 ribosome biogenesis GTPase Der [Gammaproteobacteria bacterium]
MLPVVAIAGRPNVGKSTLFNCLTRSRDALVANEPGVTRDRIYGIARTGERQCLVVDTGGLSPDANDVDQLVSSQAERAIEEADLILFIVDARDGLAGDDETIAGWLRRSGKDVVVVVNKVDGLDADVASSEFYALGFDTQTPVAAAHRRGIRTLQEIIEHRLPPEIERAEESESESVRVCVLGRPNVGKSTLINTIVGAQRLVAHDAPGTTRGSVEVPFSRDGRGYILIDTAGLRRRARVIDAVEKISALKSLRAVSASDVAVLVVDASDGVFDQDVHLLGIALEAGRSVVIAVNKSDALTVDQRKAVKTALRHTFGFADFIPVVFISALKGTGVGRLLATVDRVWRQRKKKLSTPMLTRLLEEATERNPPPANRGRRIKLRYAHVGGMDPPRIVIHGNQTDTVPESYRRYLTRIFRETLGFPGTPIKVEFRRGENPYEGKKNPLTPKQKRRRKRMMRHSRK